MITLHLERPAGGPCAFFADAPGDALADAVASVVWFPEELQATARGIVPSLRNLLMFLSDVRGRKFKRGIFLGDDVLALAEAFRRAARGVAEGRVVPDAELCDGGFRAVWRPVGGAVLTPEYAAKIGADHYSKDAMELVRLAERLLS